MMFIALFLLACNDKNIHHNNSNQPIACTMDAMQCPDGSWVGRTGKKCEFICPPQK